MRASRHLPFACPLAISLVCLVLTLIPESWQSALQYQREAIQAGELWRLISGQLTHLNLPHLLMNLAGLWLIWLMFFTREDQLASCLYRLPAILLLTTIGLWLLNPEVSWYRGLSGALHGLLALALLRQWRGQPVFHTLLLALLIGKIAWEQASGPVPASEAWISGRVIVDSHLYGTVGGGIIWLLERSHALFIKHEVTG